MRFRDGRATVSRAPASQELPWMSAGPGRGHAPLPVGRVIPRKVQQCTLPRASCLPSTPRRGQPSRHPSSSTEPARSVARSRPTPRRNCSWGGGRLHLRALGDQAPVGHGLLVAPDGHRSGRSDLPTTGHGGARHHRPALPSTAARPRRSDHAGCQRLLDGRRGAVGRVCRVPAARQGPFSVRIFTAMALADLATYVTTATQLALAFPGRRASSAHGRRSWGSSRSPRSRWPSSKDSSASSSSRPCGRGRHRSSRHWRPRPQSNPR